MHVESRNLDAERRRYLENKLVFCTDSETENGHFKSPRDSLGNRQTASEKGVMEANFVKGTTFSRAIQIGRKCAHRKEQRL